MGLEFFILTAGSAPDRKVGGPPHSPILRTDACRPDTGGCRGDYRSGMVALCLPEPVPHVSSVGIQRFPHTAGLARPGGMALRPPHVPLVPHPDRLAISALLRLAPRQHQLEHRLSLLGMPTAAGRAAADTYRGPV